MSSPEAIRRLTQQIETLRMDNAVLTASNRKLALAYVERKRLKLYYYLSGLVTGAGALALIDMLFF